MLAFRLAAVVMLGVAVSGAAAAAVYVVQRVWTGPAAIDPRAGEQAEASKRGGTGRVRKQANASRPQEPAEPLAPAGPTAPADPIDVVPLAPPSPGPGSAAATNPCCPRPHPPRRSRSESLARSPRSHADEVTLEAGLVRQALSALRQDHDPQRALSLLDDHDDRFGRGVLAFEVASARAQALLQLGDRTRALAFLDELPLERQGYPVELRVTRGELRARAGHCRDADADFDGVLETTAASREQVARALFGRASCRARTGDAAGAQADRQRYLEEFPAGAGAGQLSSPP